MTPEQMRQELDSERVLVSKYAEENATLRRMASDVLTKCGVLRGLCFWLTVFVLAESLVLGYVFAVGR